MRLLLLARHGKSDWDDPRLPDRERPLTERGRRAAGALGRVLAQLAPTPARVVSSPAVRAVSTARLAAAQLPAADVEIDPRLYPGDAESLWAVMADLDDSDDPALLVAHQPGLQDFALELAGQADRERMRLVTEFPTALLVALAFSAGSWRDVGPGTGRVVVAGVPDRLLGPGVG